VDVRTGTARSSDLDIYYEDMGDPADPPVLLIMGLGAQLLLWRTAFCEKLVAQGYRVIRYDNRDVGLSSKLDRLRAGGPFLPRLGRFWLGMRSESVYTLEDMADDAAALLDHLDIDRAHVVGASMGGMIAQVFAARFRPRTRSLALIFTNNNKRFAKPASLRGLLTLLTGPAPGSPRDVVIDHSVKVSRFIGSPRYPVPEERLRAEAIETYDRCYYPWGYTRQFGAILGSGSLLGYDRQITAPTVVMHGLADKLVSPSGGRAVARAIAGARLLLFDGMGHNLPEELWDRVISELTTNFTEAR
jgi:pimeloyl-ACP methyl ester carboxylesterase